MLGSYPTEPCGVLVLCDSHSSDSWSGTIFEKVSTNPSDSSRAAGPAYGEDTSFTDAELKVWHSFIDGGWALMAQISASFNAEGLSITDMRLLEIAAERDSAGISELAAAMHSGVSTVSRVASRLIDEGALERVASHADARHRLVRITDAGRDELRRQRLVRDAVIRKHVIEVLSPEEFEGLGSMFARIREGCD